MIPNKQLSFFSSMVARTMQSKRKVMCLFLGFQVQVGRQLLIVLTASMLKELLGLGVNYASLLHSDVNKSREKPGLQTRSFRWHSSSAFCGLQTLQSTQNKGGKP